MIATRLWTFGVVACGLGSAWFGCSTSTTNIYEAREDAGPGASGGTFPSGGTVGTDGAAEANASGGTAGASAEGGAAGTNATDGGGGTADASCLCLNPLPGECWYHDCPSCTPVPLPKDSYCKAGADQCDGLGNCVDCTTNGGCGECCVCVNQTCINT